ncbi:hypothetical protein [Oceanicoccus sp. KOV_DT_Chl]|uniref:hypothetical protein n=1 Tax=Oceanicoccus sp. KOV_DT_Chl TaxID=1904639 RepID=UPI000C7A5448|nr:hypothetical protein [Oceanicoccus sp. KOV_DT_Chl]
MEINCRYTFLVCLVLLSACTNSTSDTRITPSYYFKDTVDGGNDAKTAGCHKEYISLAGCNADNARTVVSAVGDSCLSDKVINEYRTSSCHQHNPSADISSRNCDTACGSMSGRCVTKTIDCTAGTATKVDSAECECYKTE